MTPTAVTHVRPGNVDAILSDMEARLRDDPDAPLVLDWSNVSRLETASGAILSAALLGTLGRAPLRVKVDPRFSDRHWLLTSGLAFALANRTGTTTVDGLRRDELAAWRRSWTPGTEATWRQLFGEPPPTTLFEPADIGESPLAPDLFGPYYAAFTNPHRQGASVGRDTAVTRVVWPWLDRLVPEGSRRPRRSSSRDRYIRDVGLLIDELLSNVAEHGTSLGFGPSIHSLVQVLVTRGGGERSFDRLRMSVWDTGAGIANTARPKVPDVSAELPDDGLLERLFSGDLPGWLRGRGMGLPEVASVCRRTPGASLFVATGAARLATSGRRAELRPLEAGFPIQGSVVTAVLPLGR